MSSNPPDPAVDQDDSANLTRSGHRPAHRAITLRTKLIAGVSAAILAVSVLIGVVTQILISDYLTAQLDQRIQSNVRFFGGQNDQDDAGGSGAVGNSTPGSPPGVTDACSSSTTETTSGRRAPAPQPAVFAVFDSTGTFVSGTVRDTALGCTDLTADTAVTLAHVPTGRTVTEVTIPDAGQYRVIADQSPDGQILVSGLSTAEVEATQFRLLVVMSAVAAGAVLLGAGIVWLGVRRSLRPLEQVAATARAVSELPLDRGEVDITVRVPRKLTDDRTEVGAVGAALDQLLVHVESALGARHESESRVRRFVADASHELRTPLAAIRGYAELAGRNPEDAPAVTHALGRVRSESERMTTLVDDLLLLARLDSGRPLDRDPVDLTLLTIDTTSDARVSGSEHHWQLELPEEPVTVVGDDHRLRQVLTNLLANARTHTPAGTTVVTAVREERGMAVVTVTDNGDGIPAMLQSEIFGRFVRGEQSRSRAAGSTGLGLAIVAAVVAAHHGTVGVKSEPGRTVFTVRLPLV
ncbi:HAMP domain-containing sensor histidine kinase [Nakamurella sp. A5-74]|uniref:histidine kinase n=1 Tax=Nakamurella sp. A5-74 TaxID=3158264 RepID=A0AAU8DMN7_9ACTN